MQVHVRSSKADFWLRFFDFGLQANPKEGHAFMLPTWVRPKKIRERWHESNRSEKLGGTANFRNLKRCHDPSTAAEHRTFGLRSG
jgi:hypothetical protein